MQNRKEPILKFLAVLLLGYFGLLKGADKSDMSFNNIPKYRSISFDTNHNKRIVFYTKMLLVKNGGGLTRQYALDFLERILIDFVEESRKKSIAKMGSKDEK